MNLDMLSDRLFKKILTKKGGRKKYKKSKKHKKSKKYKRRRTLRKRKTKRKKMKRRRKTRKYLKKKQRGGKVDLTFSKPKMTYQDTQAATKGAIYKQEINKAELSKLQRGGRKAAVPQMRSAGPLGNANMKRTIQALLNARIDAQGDKLAGSAKDL